MSPNTTPSAPTIRAALALLWSWDGAASVTADGLVLSEAIRSNAAKMAAARRFAPPPFACQRANRGPVATKALDSAGRRGRPWVHGCTCSPACPGPCRCQRSAAVSRGFLARAFCRDAPRRPRPSPRRQPVWALLVGDALRRHHEGRARSRDLFVGLRDGRHPDRRPAQGPGAAQLHPHGPAAPHRAAQDRGADRGAVQPRQHGRPDPRAHGGGARRPAAQRDRSTGSIASRPSSPR